MQVVLPADGEGLSGTRRGLWERYEGAPSWRRGPVLNQALTGGVDCRLGPVGGAGFHPSPSPSETRRVILRASELVRGIFFIEDPFSTHYQPATATEITLYPTPPDWDL